MKCRRMVKCRKEVRCVCYKYTTMSPHFYTWQRKLQRFTWRYFYLQESTLNDICYLQLSIKWCFAWENDSYYDYFKTIFQWNFGKNMSISAKIMRKNKKIILAKWNNKKHKKGNQLPLFNSWLKKMLFSKHTGARKIKSIGGANTFCS